MGLTWKIKKGKEKAALESLSSVRAFKNPEVTPPQAGLTGAFSTHPVKLSGQDASPAGNVDNHSLELKLHFSKSLKRYLYSGQASDNYLH